jgi:poly(A) polymerase
VLPTAREILAGVPLIEAVRRAAQARSIYLVGGAVRDASRGRNVADFDFLVADGPTVAARFARAAGGRLVVLHEDWPTARVVVRREGRRIDFDFTSPRARSLTGDLRARDFTINALAAGRLGGRVRLVDPCGGRADLAAGVVRMTSPAALESDPVRVVRAFRFVAELGFRLEPETRRACRRLADQVALASAERVGAEVMKLCAGPLVSQALAAMAGARVLQAVIPELAPSSGLWQGGAHEFDVFDHSLTAVKRLAAVIRRPEPVFPEHADRIREYATDEETRSALVLATLLHDVGKPECRVWEGGRWRFFGHEARGAAIAERVAGRLRLPRRMRKRVKLLVASHMRLLPAMGGEKMTARAQRRLVRDTAPDTVGLILLCLADRRALKRTIDWETEGGVLERLAGILTVIREMAEAPEPAEPLVTGGDLMRLGLRPGPAFREILEAVEEAWSEGEVGTKEEALGWVRIRWASKEGVS